MHRRKVLFVCVHNAARSQMAEAYLNEFGGEWFEAESAGFEPSEINPYVVEVMKEDGIDISGNTSDSVFEFYKQGRLYGFLVTVCDESLAERCPLFPGLVRERLHWSFPDPSGFEGDRETILEQTRAVRDAIREEVKAFIAQYREE